MFWHINDSLKEDYLLIVDNY